MEIKILVTLLIIGSALLAWLWRTRRLSSPSTPTLALCLAVVIMRLISQV